MKKVAGCLLGSTIIWHSACFGAIDERRLIEFWKTTMNGASISPSNHLSRLKSLGVDDLNDLAGYLNSKEFQKGALDSMWALAPESKPPTAEVFHRVISLATNQSDGLRLRMAAVRLLFNYYPDEQIAQRHFSQEAWGARADTASHMLGILGEYADRYPAKRSYALGFAQGILGMKAGYSKGDVMGPPEGSELIPVVISAMNWKLYDAPELGELTATFLFRRLTGPFRLAEEEVRPAIDFLSRKSKADAEFLAKGFHAACAGNTDRASVIIWLLNESKDSPIARRALELCVNDVRLVETLRGIQSGKVSKVEALDRPLKAYYGAK